MKFSTVLFSAVLLTASSVFAAPVDGINSLSTTDKKLVSVPAEIATTGTAPVAKPPVDQGSDFIPYYITSPSGDTTYTAGETVNFEWINGLEGDIKIYVLVGKDPKSMQDSPYKFSGVKGSAESFKWEIPKTIRPNTYSLKFVYDNGTKKNQEAYSGQFRVVAASAPAAVPANNMNTGTLHETANDPSLNGVAAAAANNLNSAARDSTTADIKNVGTAGAASTMKMAD